MVTFALLFKPSTIPLEKAFFALNQFRISSLCARIVLATFFMGSICERITRVHQRSRNFSAQAGETYSQKPLKSSFQQVGAYRSQVILENLFELDFLFLR